MVYQNTGMIPYLIILLRHIIKVLVRHIIIILSYPSFFFLRNLGRLPLQSQLVLYHGPTYCFNGFIRGEKIDATSTRCYAAYLQRNFQ
jgi:hypothetical protein